MSTDLRHFRNAVRSLRRRPGFLAVAVLSLALAIALNTTMYSILDAMLDPRIDVRAPERVFTARYYGDYRHRLDASAVELALTSGLHGYEVTASDVAMGRGVPVTHAGHLRQTTPISVRGDFFPFLGTHPLQGHLEARGSDAGLAKVVISDRYADALFPGDALPVGQSIDIDGKPYTVVGVVQHSSAYPLLDANVWIFSTDRWAANGHAWLIRLRPGADSLTVARALDVIAARLALEAGESPRETRFILKRFGTRQFRIGSFHLALIAAVLAVLLVACANLANLQLARGIGRSRELALRTALGATRGQIIRELTSEVAVLAAAGLALGLLLTAWGIHIVRASIPHAVSEYLIEPQTSWRLVACAILATVLCLALVGLVPAWRVSRVDPNDLLKSGAGTGAHRQNLSRYGALLVAQIALALPLLSGAVLLLRGTWQATDPAFVAHEWFGYDPSPLVVSYLGPPRVFGRASVANVASQLVARARSIAGVADAALDTPHSPDSARITIDDGAGPVEVPAPMWTYHAVSSSYLRTMGTPIARGRDFAEGEYDAPPVVVDGTTALYLWHGVDPVGRLMKLGSAGSHAAWLRVVGVAGDLRTREKIEFWDPYFGHHLGAVYRVITPADTFLARGNAQSVRLMVRARTSPAQVALALRQRLREMPSLGSIMVLSLEDMFGLTARREQVSFVAALFSVFALLAVALAALGVYGIVWHTVVERRRELAVRISLGATGRDVVHASIRQGNALALAGIAIGLFFTWWTAGWVAPFLLQADDLFNAPLFLFIAVLLFATAVSAALVPALRAMRIDPVDALRHE